MADPHEALFQPLPWRVAEWVGHALSNPRARPFTLALSAGLWLLGAGQGRAQSSAYQTCPDRKPSLDFWRVVGGRTNDIKGPGWESFFGGNPAAAARRPIYAEGWYEIFGTAQALTRDGLLVRGYCGLMDNQSADQTFLVTNYPRPLAPGDYVHRSAARYLEVYDFGGTTVRRLDYGIVCSPPESIPQQSTATEARPARPVAEQQKPPRSQEAIAAYYLKLAESGNAHAQYRLGQCYLAGEGIGKDLQKAREYFSKAAAQGNESAAKALAELPKN